MTQALNWGILGTGAIARKFAEGVMGSRTGRLAAVGSRSQDTADRFARDFDIPNRHGSYEALLGDDDVQAVYIATPHPMHARWAVRCAEAGKHILCEKPLTLNHAEAMAVVEAAHRHDVFLMEAFMYRCHPQTARLVELIRDGAIGRVRVIQATFSFHCSPDPGSRLMSNALGGGGILDVGCYCTSMARLIAGAATGGEVAEPIDVRGAGHLGETGVDEWAIASLRFPGDIVASLATGVQVHQENVLRIFGSEGQIVVPSPWVPQPDGGTDRILVCRHDASGPEEILVESDRGLYAIEADTVAEHIERRQAAWPAMTWDDTLGNMMTLDRWRASIGLVYDAEKLDADIPTVHGRPLATLPKQGTGVTPVNEEAGGSPANGCGTLWDGLPARHRTGWKPVPQPEVVGRGGPTLRASRTDMKYGRLPGVDKPASRVVMGVDNQHFMPHAVVMFDDFFERGGTCFDTARCYGSCEQVLGRWVEQRGLRDQVVIVDKGAHTPFCTPKDLTRELMISLDALRTDHVDLYLMHRDNADVPVGEFIDVMDEHLRAGCMRCFGVSNWTLGRIDEANAYARRQGRSPIAVVSNQFSLARMLDPVWPGCVSASDPASRAWFERTQTPLLAWSSQARRFFATHDGPGQYPPEQQSRTGEQSRDREGADGCGTGVPPVSDRGTGFPSADRAVAGVPPGQQSGDRQAADGCGTGVSPVNDCGTGFQPVSTAPFRFIDRTDEEFARCWSCDDNLRRRERAAELAVVKGVHPINIALAWVLHQPFPTFPLIGPRTLAETRVALRALEITLTPEEVAWVSLA